MSEYKPKRSRTKRRKEREQRRKKQLLLIGCGCAALVIVIAIIVIIVSHRQNTAEGPAPETAPAVTETVSPTPELTETPEPAETVTPTETPEPVVTETPVPEDEVLSWNPDWEYADCSAAHGSTVTLYYSHAENRTGIVVAVNAGHGSVSASNVKTLCHPDGSAKVTGGTTASGSTYSTGASGGTTFLDGTSEASANLSLALLLKEKLLDAGYDVLMLRESDDCDLDNIARTVYANQYADCHIALHYDSTENDKGFFFISVPENESYRAMEPVASHWQQHMAFGEALLQGEQEQGVKVYSSGSMEIDLTQTSFSTIPSIDAEVGDRGSDHSEATQNEIAEGLVRGVEIYFSEYPKN